MKNIQLVLTIAALFSVTAIRADLIETAISDHDAKLISLLVGIGTTHNNTFAVTKAQKDKYIKLASAQVEKATAKTKDHFSLNSVMELDLFSIVAFGLLATGSGITIYNNYKEEDPKKNIVSMVGIGSCIAALGNAIRSLKDFSKHSTDRHSKAKETLKKAEKVQLLVDALPVKA